MAGGNREILSDHGVWGCGWGCADAVQQKDARQKMIFDPHLWDLSNTTGGREAGGGCVLSATLRVQGWGSSKRWKEEDRVGEVTALHRTIAP